MGGATVTYMCAEYFVFSPETLPPAELSMTCIADGITAYWTLYDNHTCVGKSVSRFRHVMFTFVLLELRIVHVS